MENIYGNCTSGYGYQCSYSRLRSKYGASFKLLSLVDSNHFKINLSVPLALEYEEVAKRENQQGAIPDEDIDNILDFLCRVANFHEIFFLWRPYLKDFKDDFVFELAMAAGYDIYLQKGFRC